LATIGQFAAGMAHEVRNPLTAIRSTVQYLANDFAHGSEQQHLAEALLDEVDRLDQLVGGLVALARPADSSIENVQVDEEILACVSFVEARGRSQGITLRTDLQDGIQKASCNSAELRQVLLNVIMNALQAMPEGGTLSIKASTVESDSGRILIEVTDEGVGIPPDLRHRVFEPFFTTKQGGTGLGLAICSNIIRRYNGEIWIDPAEGGGTAVRIALPASASTSERGTYREEAESPDSG
jgi:signal transduction histidine kinase